MVSGNSYTRVVVDQHCGIVEFFVSQFLSC